VVALKKQETISMYLHVKGCWQMFQWVVCMRLLIFMHVSSGTFAVWEMPCGTKARDTTILR